MTGDVQATHASESFPLSLQERHAVAAAVSGGRIYAVGGYAGLNEDEEEGLVPRRLDTVESYDPSEASEPAFPSCLQSSRFAI